LTKYYRKGDAIDVTIEKIVPRGFGLGFAENLTVLVPLSAPGDVLRVRIREIKKRTAFAEIVMVKQAGPRRITAPCEYYGKCGGCDMQHLDYKAQLEAKRGIVLDCLRRIGKIELTREIEMIGSPNQFEYRSRARLHVDRPAGAIGFFGRESHTVIDIPSCPIMTPGLQSSLEYIRESMDWFAMPGDVAEIEAATGDEGRVSIMSDVADEPPAELSFAAGGNNYLFSADTFFQANKSLIGPLIETAIGDSSGETAFDLYSGVGLFTLPMARRFDKVIAVEESKASADLAKKNVENARLANVKVVNKAVERFLAANKVKKVDLLLLDPPRSGADTATIAAIGDLRPAQISYVSCEPSILARDLRILIDAGYEIGSVTALDLFPQTHHVETIVRLSRS